MINSQSTFPLKLFYACFVLSLLAALLAITQAILVGVFGFMGFDSSTPITALCLTTLYWLVKFSDLSGQYKIIFIHSLACALTSIGTAVIMVLLLVKIRNGQLFTIDGAFKALLYVLASLTVYCAIVEGGYFLTYYTEVGQCFSYVYNSTQLLILTIIGMLAVGVAFALWTLLLCVYSRESEAEEKYREKSQQAVQEKQYYQQQQENKPREEYKQQQQQPQQQQIEKESRFKNYGQPQREVHQQTQQNLYDSPSRRPVAQTYSQQPQEQQPVFSHQPAQKSIVRQSPSESRQAYKQMPILEPREGNQSRFKADEYNNRASPKQESHLRSDPSRFYNNESRFKNSPPRSRQEPQQGLVYHKKAHESPEKSRYMQTLLKESKQYLNQRGDRSILDSSGHIQERERSDYYRSGNHADKEHVPHHRRHAPEREGVLLNYIRGKYAG